MNLFLGEYIFGDLRNWSIFTGISAGVLCASAIMLLVANLILKRHAQWQNVIFLLGLVMGAWSLLIAYGAYQQWNAMVQQTSPHGYAVTTMAFADIYHTGVSRCQGQCLLTLIAIVLLLLIAGWSAWTSRAPTMLKQARR
jgi:hypothetical protein